VKRFWFIALICWLTVPLLPAEKIALRGVPLAIAYIDDQNMVDRGFISIVLWDGKRKVVVTGQGSDRAAMTALIAMVQAEIDDGDQQEITVECTRRNPTREDDRGFVPGPRYGPISSVEVEGNKWNRDVWHYALPR
jgi:hypothetical protein